MEPKLRNLYFGNNKAWLIMVIVIPVIFDRTVWVWKRLCWVGCSCGSSCVVVCRGELFFTVSERESDRVHNHKNTPVSAWSNSTTTHCIQTALQDQVFVCMCACQLCILKCVFVWRYVRLVCQCLASLYILVHPPCPPPLCVCMCLLACVLACTCVLRGRGGAASRWHWQTVTLRERKRENNREKRTRDGGKHRKRRMSKADICPHWPREGERMNG